jgi:hypothetical protein
MIINDNLQSIHIVINLALLFEQALRYLVIFIQIFLIIVLHFADYFDSLHTHRANFPQ